MTPLSPNQYIAPPLATPLPHAELFMNLQLSTQSLLVDCALYIAPPPPLARLFVKLELFIIDLALPEVK